MSVNIIIYATKWVTILLCITFFFHTSFIMILFNIISQIRYFHKFCTN